MQGSSWILVEPTEHNGLNKTSQIMVDKLYTTSREKIAAIIGVIGANILRDVERSMALFLGTA